MAKSFKGNTPIDKLSGAAHISPVQAAPEEDPKAAVEPKKEPAEVKEPKQKGKSGRKPIDPSGMRKKDYTKTINIAIPLDIMEKVNVAKVCYNNNVTTYINKLVERDIEANYANYKKLVDSLNSFK